MIDIKDEQVLKAIEGMKKKDFNKICRENLKPIRDKERELAPVKTGALRRAIKIRTIRSRKIAGAKVSISWDGSQREWYGLFQEVGFTHKGGTKVEGKHFYKQAYDELGKSTINQTRQDIVRELDRP